MRESHGPEAALAPNGIWPFCPSAWNRTQLYFRDQIVDIAVPAWTKKFTIPKGHVTTRNKYLRCAKLCYGYDPRQKRFVTIKATPGKVELCDVSGLLTRRVLRFGQPASLHALFDAGEMPREVLEEFRTGSGTSTKVTLDLVRQSKFAGRIRSFKRCPS